MRILLEKLFKKKVKENTKFIKAVSKILTLQKELDELKEELQDAEAKFFLEYQEEFFISLKDFLELLNSKTLDNLSIAELLLLFKHISEIKPDNFSSVEIYAFPEKDHIILCEDPTNCDIHKNSKGRLVNVSTIKSKKV